MKTFKFLRKEQQITIPITVDIPIARRVYASTIANELVQPMNNGNIYSYEFTLQPIKSAIADAINICNISDITYENYEHYYHHDNRRFKLKVLDIRRFTNPVYSYFIIRYKMGRDIINLDEHFHITQLFLQAILRHCQDLQSLTRDHQKYNVNKQARCYSLIQKNCKL